MDPNKVLARLLELAAKNRESDDPELAEMATCAENLDGWLVGGGFKPKRWQR